MQKIKMSQFQGALQDALKNYKDDVGLVLKDIGKDVAKEAVKKLKKESPERTGEYARSWKYKKDKETSARQMADVYVVYNKEHFRLTHLLEFGHIVMKSGKRYYPDTPPKPHIADVDEWIAQTYPDRIIRELEK